MKPKYKSKKALQYTQAIAKMIEFEVPPENRNIRISKEPEDLLVFTIGILTDYVHELTKAEPDLEKLYDQENDLVFCSHYFDAYQNTKRSINNNDFLLLIGAITYYLSNQPGNAYVLLNKINIQTLDLQSSYLDKIIVSILLNKPIYIDFSQVSLFILSEQKLIESYSNFIKTGKENEKILECIIRLEKIAFYFGLDDEILLTKYLHAILIKKIQNSCWINLPSFTNLPQDVWKTVITKSSFIKELWPSQLYLGREGIFQGKSAVIQMPTSSGKTRSIEIIIRSSFMAKRTNIAVIIAPFRALCNEIRDDYTIFFKGESNIEINDINDALETDDITLFSDESKKHIIILTPEKFYYLLVQDRELASKIHLIIFDEGHQFDTNERGVTYELLLTELNTLLPYNSQKVLISAVLNNADKIAAWLSSNKKVLKGNKLLPTLKNIAFINNYNGIYQLKFVDPSNIDSEEFYVPRTITPFLLTNSNVFPNIDNSIEVSTYLALKMCKKNSVAIYINQKRSITNFLDTITNLITQNPQITIPASFCDRSEVEKISYLIKENFSEHSLFYFASLFGIYPHHTNVPEGIRNCIEYAYRESLINFIVCTSTLAQGVNLPIKYLFVTTSQQGDGYFRIRDFQNFIGRVGRAGKLTEGSIIFTDISLKENTKKWFHIKELLNNEEYDDCSSSIIELCSPFTNLWGELIEDCDFSYIQTLLEVYYEHESIETITQLFLENYAGFNYSNLIGQYKSRLKNSIKRQITRKFNYIAKIENFLMLLGEPINEKKCIEIAKSTLAYQLMDNDKKKNELLKLFLLIGAHFVSKNIESKKLKIYSKSLKGLDEAISLENNIKEIFNSDFSYRDQIELFQKIWPLFEEYISNSHYKYIRNRKKIEDCIIAWINGENFFTIFEKISDERISRNAKIDLKHIDYCVDLFESAISYEGTILINSIIELIPNEFKNYEIDLRLLEKQIKYGLPDSISISVYEKGFCDRTLSQKIADVFKIQKYDFISNEALIQNKKEISNILENYPSYFSKKFHNLISKYT